MILVTLYRSANRNYLSLYPGAKNYARESYRSFSCTLVIKQCDHLIGQRWYYSEGLAAPALRNGRDEVETIRSFEMNIKPPGHVAGDSATPSFHKTRKKGMATCLKLLFMRHMHEYYFTRNVLCSQFCKLVCSAGQQTVAWFFSSPPPPCSMFVSGSRTSLRTQRCNSLLVGSRICCRFYREAVRIPDNWRMWTLRH